MKKVRKFFLTYASPIILTLFMSFDSGAQVTANFSANITSGCSPQTILFSDLSTGPVTYWEWHFGNGNTSYLQTPISTYGDPGKYTVTLIVSDGTNWDTLVLKDYITIFKNPEVYFSAIGGPDGCDPFTVTFNDSTVLGDAPITQWIWDFGDGTVDNSGNPAPTHTYNGKGTYSVSLQVIDANGCSHTLLLKNYITVSETPVANFTASATSSCAPPLTVNFTNTSTGAPPLTYYWVFGDGSTSSSPNPSNTYTNPGNYTVKLVVTNAQGCVDSLVSTNLIVINIPQAGMNVKDTVCVNELVSFNNTSVGGSNYLWNFGDGGTSGQANPTHPYSATGTYTITLIASDPTGNCKDTITKNIVVIDMTPAFTSTPNYGCQVPHTVNFTDQTTGAVSWYWDFGDGANSTQQNPSHTYNSTGTYTVFLIATNKYGCSDTITYTNHVVINPIQADFSGDTIRGCLPLNVNFLDLSVSDSTITSWYWVFGDGSTSDQPNPSNTYNQDGDFTVTLVIVNALGCTDSVSKLVEVGKKIPPLFDALQDTVCAFDGADFMDLTNDSLIDYWFWNTFGDGGTDNTQNPHHMYVDTGWMDVTLILGYNGCEDTLKIDSLLYVHGPIVRFSAPADCDNPFVYQFTSNMIDAQRWYWNFGDGSPIDSVSINPIHTYATRGHYLVTLDAYNDSTGCYWHEENEFDVTVPIAVINPDTLIGCLTYKPVLNGSGSQDAFSYQWSLGNGSTSSVAKPTGNYTATGLYNLRLIVTDINNCKDTAYGQVKVIDPIANFSVDTVEGCVPLLVNFTDSSWSDTTIVSWLWNFGDGGTSNQPNPGHTFYTNGTKTVSLTITDALGCKKTITKNNLVKSKQPTPNFTVSDQTICQGDSVKFTDGSSGKSPFTYLWNFGDGNTSSTPSPWHTYLDTGLFNVTLTIIDADGCDSTVVKSTYIHVQGIPIALIASDKTEAPCYPNLISFKDSSISGYITSWLWSFGDGGTSTQPNPQHNYTQPGEYDVGLIVTTSYGCKDTIDILKFIKINGPVASFHLEPDTICKGELSTFYIDSTWNVSSWIWDFGDGAGETGSGTTTTHIYQQTGLLYPTMIYRSANGCTQYYRDTIFIHEVVADFHISDTASCYPLITSFSDSSTGPDIWTWDFGDGNTSSQANPNHTFNQPGNYAVTLIILNQATGCRDTLIKTVHAYPPPAVTITPSAILCEGDSLHLLATGGIYYQWSPPLWLSDTAIADPWSKPQGPIEYIVTVTDANGCSASDSMTINIQGRPNMNLPPDTTIVIGELVDNMDGFAGNGFIYTWSPVEGLSCATCPNPIAQPLVYTCYMLTVTDPNQCFVLVDTMCIDVEEKYSLDVPKAFTPNNDGNNDIIYVRGWGIKDLIEFKIYNRWGELVFESTDMNHGWDGTYKGKLQNIETYVYVASGRTYSGKVLSKKGHIALLR